MAQLLKLADYVSRYEIDIYRYPSRYVRLKKERWQRVQREWAVQKNISIDRPFWESYEEEVKTFFQKSWNKLRRKAKMELDDEIELPSEQEMPHQSKEQMKASFLEELFKFQINWVSSTVSERSAVKRSYYYDSLLEFLVKKLPDSFFILYEPVFFLKKATVDLDVIILTPSEIWLIKPLLGNENTIFQFDSDRFWSKKDGKRESKFLHPIISLNRMRTVIESILEEKNLSMPMKQVIVAKNSYIDIPQHNQRAKLIDKRNFHEFHEQFLKNKSPIKHTQLKIADALLAKCMTNSSSRLITESENAETIDTFDEYKE
ncbi:nuclease-related domain-containing protein [Salipaludibacillus sp. CF4.18]|uniref:nuclease-related domain-containing protein n=1 Tax=Salipaludibacillus sp. CF4.18 TaxID=3373081 RepID=UPI003EE62E49